MSESERIQSKSELREYAKQDALDGVLMYLLSELDESPLPTRGAEGWQPRWDALERALRAAITQTVDLLETESFDVADCNDHIVMDEEGVNYRNYERVLGQTARMLRGLMPKPDAERESGLMCASVALDGLLDPYTEGPEMQSIAIAITRDHN